MKKKQMKDGSNLKIFNEVMEKLISINLDYTLTAEEVKMIFDSFVKYWKVYEKIN